MPEFKGLFKIIMQITSIFFIIVIVLSVLGFLSELFLEVETWQK